MLRLISLALFAAAAYSQDTADLFNKAPAGVDQALRARMTDFYHYHVTGEYRKAESLVAEDTKDYFYDHDKPRYLSFDIGKIEYSDGYTHAKAIVKVKLSVMLPGFNGKVMEIPTPSYWRVIDGQWYWYIDKAMMNASPFGEMKAGPNSAANNNSGQLPSIPGSTDQLYAMVHADKSELALKQGSSQEVSIASSMPGPVDVKVASKPDGVDVSFDHDQIPSGGKAVMTVRAAGNVKEGALVIMVVQTGQLLKFPIATK